MDIQFRLKEGEALFIDGQIAEAETIFQDIILTQPEHPDVLNNMGVISHSRGDIQKAEQFFLNALNVHGEYADALSNLADLYESTKQRQKAISVVKRLIALKRGNHSLQEKLKQLEENSSVKELQPHLNSKIKQPEKRVADSRHTMGVFTEPGSLRALFLEVNITPPIIPTKLVYLQGMAGEQRRAVSVSMPLMMQILLIEDANFTKILMITADLFGFGNEMVSQVRQIASHWGIQPEGIILNASHTHYAPGTVSHISSELGPYYAQYATAIVNSIGESLDILYYNLEECEIGLGHTDLQTEKTTRLPDKNTILSASDNIAFHEHFAPFLQIKMKSSQKKLVLINYGCHLSGLGRMAVISPDCVGYLRESIRESGIADGVMFLQGGAGSIQETAGNDNRSSSFLQSIDDVKKTGTYMAEKIALALKSPMLAVGGNISCTSATAYLPKKNQLSSSIPMELQMISIGKEVRLVSMPGEPVSKLAIKLREASGVPDGTMVLGYTNGLANFFSTDATDVETEDEIIKTFQYCFNKTGLEEDASGYGRHYLNKNPKRAFFVLSSGRCGTMTLSNILDIAENARVWHHPRPYMIKETLLAYWNKIDKPYNFWKARSSIIQRSWSEGLIHGETDHNITPFCDMLAHELPLAKFLVLVRDPRDFIRSGMRRNYYQSHEWDVGRLRPEEDNPDYLRWMGMEPFRKVCWLWAQTYDYIHQTVNTICDSRVLLVRFEDLVSGTEKAHEIFDFLELTGFSEQKIKDVFGLRLNKQKGPDFPKAKDWPETWNEVLRLECSVVAEKYGYELDQPKTTAMHNDQISAQTAHNIYPVKHVPQVGVGLPVYSGGDLLEGAIASVLNQEFKDLEMVVLDLGTDPRTQEICNNFQKTDPRLRYVNSGEDRDYVSKDSFLRVMDLTSSPYFMWASYDDRHLSTFLSKAVDRFNKDSDIALVYFISQLANAQGLPIPTSPDAVNAVMDDPLERFSHVIWNLDLCNAFYGLFRREILLKSKTFKQHLYRAYDNLLLAEVALYGKIFQLDEVLFIRGMTRPRNNSLEENNADVIRSWEPSALDKGITFPLCRLTYAHCELISQYAANREQRNRLVQEIVTCFRKRFGPRMQGEIQRALDLISHNIFYRTWDGREDEPMVTYENDPLERLRLHNLLAGMQEACFIYPDWPQLMQTYQECQMRISNLHPVPVANI